MEEGKVIVNELCMRLKGALETKRKSKNDVEFKEMCREAIDVYEAKEEFYLNSPHIVFLRHKPMNTIDVTFEITKDSYYTLNIK